MPSDREVEAAVERLSLIPDYIDSHRTWLSLAVAGKTAARGPEHPYPGGKNTANAVYAEDIRIVCRAALQAADAVRELQKNLP